MMFLYKILNSKAHNALLYKISDAMVGAGYVYPAGIARIT